MALARRALEGAANPRAVRRHLNAGLRYVASYLGGPAATRWAAAPPDAHSGSQARKRKIKRSKKIWLGPQCLGGRR